MLKIKLLKILILSCFIFALATKGVLAYSGDNSIQKWEDDVYGKQTEYNSPSFNHETIKNLEKSAINQIFGVTQEQYQKASGEGAIASLGNLIALIYSNPPVSSKEYFADVGRSLGIVKTAYAQGIGFTGLKNLLPLWKAMRNLAYIAFVIVFLFMGLAIMLRIKLDPKTVVTIQNAIPKLVIGLLLVTFSYAIAGLMIDLIYLMIYLGVLALQGPLTAANGSGYSIVTDQAKFANLGFGDAVLTIVGGTFKGIFGSWVAGIGGGILVVLSGLIAGLMTATVGFGVAGAALLPVLIIGIIVMFLVFKLLISLIGCYISIIVSVIIAPLQILLGVFPGSQGGFGAWFRNLLANILVFPAVAFVILFGWLLTAKNYGPTWSPPVLSVSGGALTAVLGLGMLLLVNKVPDMVKSAFKIKPAGYGTAIGQALGPAKTVGTMGLGEIIGRGGRMEGWSPPGGVWEGRAATLRKIFGFKS